MRVIDTSGLRSFRIPIGGDAGDLLVVNTSAVVPAALDARGSDGNGLRLHLSTEQPGGFWVVEPRHRAGPGTERYVGTPPAHLVLPGGGRAELLAPYPAGTGLVRLWLPPPHGARGPPGHPPGPWEPSPLPPPPTPSATRCREPRRRWSTPPTPTATG